MFPEKQVRIYVKDTALFSALNGKFSNFQTDNLISNIELPI